MIKSPRGAIFSEFELSHFSHTPTCCQFMNRLRSMLWFKLPIYDRSFKIKSSNNKEMKYLFQRFKTGEIQTSIHSVLERCPGSEAPTEEHVQTRHPISPRTPAQI